MSLQKKIKLRAQRRTFRVRNKFVSKGLKPRISVFRSLQHIYAQIIDDASQITLLSFSSKNFTEKVGDKKEVAKRVGVELGKMAAAKEITDVFFDRGSYLYHGRVKALADGLREGGLKF
jgi:large subunit ribosomal protein L18